VIPSLGTDIDFCAQLASTGTVVFDADYRKAPEHPFPAGYQDGQDVLSYLQAHSSDFDTEHLTISGFSAGANIAMALAVNAPSNSLAGIAAIYGNADMTKAYPAPDPTAYDSGGILPGWLRSFFYKCLVLPGQDVSDPRLSPTYAPLNRWPKHCFFACGTADSLHDSTKVVAGKLKEAGHADVEFMSVEREAHAFDKAPKEGSPTRKRRDEMYRRAMEMVKRAQKDV
jgi:acetyl esterase/lipase